MSLPKESTIIDISHKEYMVEDKNGIKDTVKEKNVFAGHECPKIGIKR